jgi:hypothetical protein
MQEVEKYVLLEQVVYHHDVQVWIHRIAHFCQGRGKFLFCEDSGNKWVIPCTEGPMNVSMCKGVVMDATGCKWMQRDANEFKGMQRGAKGCKWVQTDPMHTEGCKGMQKDANQCRRMQKDANEGK